MSKPRYTILDLATVETDILSCLVRAKLVAYATRKGYVIVARYGVNKTTLGAILKKELTK